MKKYEILWLNLVEESRRVDDEDANSCAMPVKTESQVALLLLSFYNHESSKAQNQKHTSPDGSISCVHKVMLERHTVEESSQAVTVRVISR